MIEVTRLNGEPLSINEDLIEFMEETPDTVISFLTGKKLVVKEKISEIEEKIVVFKKKIYQN
ncbi:MAG: flagellar protein FlbD [Lachnospiraceae bacterium]|nr:flagellar protein FlbD [Lachnospiraceae bacterium]MBQ4069109.1 flagellar FlbD family protein [Lachnospiraceae bacterium]